MKARYFMLLQAVFLGLGLLVLIPSMNPATPASAVRTGNPEQLNTGADLTSQHVSNSTNHDANGQPKPLAVWECTTSWYGEDFDGKQTANGETYDMNDLEKREGPFVVIQRVGCGIVGDLNHVAVFHITPEGLPGTCSTDESTGRSVGLDFPPEV